MISLVIEYRKPLRDKKVILAVQWMSVRFQNYKSAHGTSNQVHKAFQNFAIH